MVQRPYANGRRRRRIGKNNIMAETTYESKITASTSNVDSIYKTVSNLSNLDKVKDLIPQDKIQEMEAGEDYIRFKVDGLGQKICIRIVGKEENNYVKFGLEDAPLPAEINFWIQMKAVEDGSSRIKLTLRGDIPMMIKMMFESKLKQGLDQAADMLAQMPFDQWQNK